MISPETETLVGSVDDALGYLIESGQTGAAQYGILSGARSGLLSEPPGSPAYAASELTAQNNIAQVQDMRRDAFAQDPTSDPEFGAAACDCEPGEPCCLRAYEVEDSEDGSRKVVWPIPPDGPDRLYLAAKAPLNGSPSAKAKVTLTDKQPCQLNFAKPAARPVSHADGPNHIMDSDEVTFTSPFQMPAFYSALLPREAMVVIYLLGLMVQVSTFRNHRPAQVNPDQCMTPGATGIEVFALPYCDASASLTGQVSIALSLTSPPMPAAGLSGQVSATVGNQSFDWTQSTSVASAPRRSPAQGPINHPLFDFLDKIRSSMDVLAVEERTQTLPRNVLSPANIFSLELKLVVQVTIGTLKLEGKSSSPNLELSLDPFSISINPSVTGTIDLWQLMLSRIPGGRDIARALARRDGAVTADAKCEIQLGGGGTAMMELQDGLNIEIGSGDDLEQQFGAISPRFTATCELTARIMVQARMGIDTIFITAHAMAGASVSTGWQFGGRVQANADGTQKWERMHFFQGIILRGHASVTFGSEARDASSNVFAPEGSDVDTTTSSSDVFDAQSTVADHDWERVFMRADGDSNHWYDS